MKQRRHRGTKIAHLLACLTIGFPPLASATVILSTDFDGRTVSGSTAGNLNWTTTGVSAPGDLTANTNPDGLFTTPAAADRFAVNRNLHTEGSWSVDIDLNVLAGNDIQLGDITLDALIFNNGGALQTVNRNLSLSLELFDSTSASLDSALAPDIYSNSGSATQPQSVTFDLSGNTLLAGAAYSLTLTASGSGPGNNAGIDNLVVNGDLQPVSIPVPPLIALLGLGLAVMGMARRLSTH